MGIERLLELAKPPLEPRSGVYLGVLSESATKKALKATYELRKKIKTVYEYELKSLKSHLKQADKSECLWCACIGENELIDDTVWVKNLENKEERTVPYSTFKDGSWLTMD
jgi:histidyl-tRNA synthetase